MAEESSMSPFSFDTQEQEHDESPIDRISRIRHWRYCRTSVLRNLWQFTGTIAWYGFDRLGLRHRQRQTCPMRD